MKYLLKMFLSMFFSISVIFLMGFKTPILKNIPAPYTMRYLDIAYVENDGRCSQGEVIKVTGGNGANIPRKYECVKPSDLTLSAREGSSTLKHKQAVAGKSIRLETELQEDGKPIRLAYVVYKPAGDGPFPVLVFNHGSTGSGRNTDIFTRTWRANTIAGLFKEKGWAVVFPHRRGRGKSDGLYDEGFRDLRWEGYSCSPHLSLPGVDRALTDIEAAIKALKQLDYIDTQTIVIGGQSRGGILSVAYAGEHPEQVKGVINFVGGWISDRCDLASHINEKTFTRGSNFVHSTLWLYGKGDRFYSVDHSRSNFAAFESAGGKGSFHVYDVPGGSGHSLIYSPDLWRDEVIKYMQNIGFSEFK